MRERERDGEQSKLWEKKKTKKKTWAQQLSGGNGEM